MSTTRPTPWTADHAVQLRHGDARGHQHRHQDQPGLRRRRQCRCPVPQRLHRAVQPRDDRRVGRGLVRPVRIGDRGDLAGHATRRRGPCRQALPHPGGSRDGRDAVPPRPGRDRHDRDERDGGEGRPGGVDDAAQRRLSDRRGRSSTWSATGRPRTAPKDHRHRRCPTRPRPCVSPTARPTRATTAPTSSSATRTRERPRIPRRRVNSTFPAQLDRGRAEMGQRHPSRSASPSM